jgi:hypothetical protein
MTLRTNLRAVRTLTTIVACAGLALSPAVATAAAKSKQPTKKTSTREGQNKRPTATVRTVKKTQAANPSGLVDRLGLSATTQLAAMNTGLKTASAFFPGRTTGCTFVTAMLTAQPGPIMGGNFRDAGGACYVWLNMEQSSMLTGSDICKVTLHEYGHLTGLEHTADPSDIMYSPFQADPTPSVCQA